MGVARAAGCGECSSSSAGVVAFVSPSTNLVVQASARAHVYRRGPLY